MFYACFGKVTYVTNHTHFALRFFCKQNEFDPSIFIFWTLKGIPEVEFSFSDLERALVWSGSWHNVGQCNNTPIVAIVRLYTGGRSPDFLNHLITIHQSPLECIPSGLYIFLQEEGQDTIMGVSFCYLNQPVWNHEPQDGIITHFQPFRYSVLNSRYTGIYVHSR